MMVGTLLTGEPLKPEQELKQQRLAALEEEATDAADLVVNMWFEAFSAGEVSFKTYCRNVSRALQVKNLAPFWRQKKMGAAVEAALQANPPKRTRKSTRASPSRLKSIYFEMVELVHKKERVPKTLIGKRTAFDCAVDVLKMRGIITSRDAVWHAWKEYSSSSVGDKSE